MIEDGVSTSSWNGQEKHKQQAGVKQQTEQQRHTYQSVIRDVSHRDHPSAPPGQDHHAARPPTTRHHWATVLRNRKRGKASEENEDGGAKKGLAHNTFLTPGRLRQANKFTCSVCVHFR